MLTGGGTGGHISPLLAVAQELKKLDPNSRIVYIGERGGKFAHMMEGVGTVDQVYAVHAGKFRRYHNESWLRHVFDFRINALNVRDAIFVVIGFFESLRLLGKIKPSVILLKGGYVGVPVGLAASFKRLPFITHDSDIMPGLANRLVGRWARCHATGMPAKYYKYPSESVRHVGVLVVDEYQSVTPPLQKQYKIDLGISSASRVVLVTGGSQGARAINLAMVRIAKELLKKHSDLHIVHQVGKGNERVYGEYEHHRLHVLEFLKDMHIYTGAADIVVTRAGANTMAELGVQGKATIVVPNPRLTGGHQLKNAQYLLQHKAISLVDEEAMNRGDGGALQKQIEELLGDSVERQKLSENLKALTIPDASERLALLLLETASSE